jgi:hypothetical protein
MNAEPPHLIRLHGWLHACSTMGVDDPWQRAELLERRRGQGPFQRRGTFAQGLSAARSLRRKASIRPYMNTNSPAKKM